MSHADEVLGRDDDEVRRHLLTMIGQLTADPIPLLGSQAWIDAPGPVRLASALRAALCWLEENNPHRLAVAVEAELEAARRYDEGDYRGWVRLAQRVRATANEPTHAQLVQARSA